MGYYADCLECTLEIACENADLFMRLAGFEDYSLAMEDILGEMNLECGLPHDDRYPLSWMGGKYSGLIEERLAVLAPSFVDGSFISFIGEDQAIWRLLVRDGGLVYETGRVVFD